MNSAGSVKPYRAMLLAGILVGIFLIILAAIILVQLLIFPLGDVNRFANGFIDKRIVETILFTIYQAGLSTIFSIVVGVVLAWSLANRQDFPFRSALIALISSALVLPTLVVVLGIVTVYGRNGWLADLTNTIFSEKLPFSIYGLTGILLAHTFFNASFAARIFLHRFETIPDERHKLCFALGIGFWRRLKIVELPVIASALPGLAITIFLLCFTSFAIVLTLGGSPAYNTLEVAIYEAIRFDFDLPKAFQLAMTQITICIILVFLANSHADTLSPPASVKRLSRYHHLYSSGEIFFQYTVILVFAIFFVSPLAAVAVDGAGPQFVRIFVEPIFLRALVNSILIAAASTVVALTFSLAIASAIATLSLPVRLTQLSRNSSFFSGSLVSRILVSLLSISAMVYLVFPALVMGLGFFLLFQRLGGNPVIWAAVVVTIANSLISIPFAVSILRPAIIAAAKKHDRLSASLGLGKWLRWNMVDWPALKSDITYAAALAFCFSLGDLGVIALFGSDEFRTLPWLLYQKFGSYRTQEAGAIALTLLLLVIVIFWLAQLTSKQEKSG